MDPGGYSHLFKDAPFNQEQKLWLSGFMAGLSTAGAVILPTDVGVPAQAPSGSATPSAAPASGKLFTKDKPFPAALLTNRILNGKGSAKDTRHFEINLEGSGLSYEPGDALGVVPTNWPEYVDDLIKALGYTGKEEIPLPQGGKGPLREAFINNYDVTKASRNLIEAVANKAGTSKLKDLLTLKPESTKELSDYMWGREIIDLFLENPSVKMSPEELVPLLKKLLPRLYSIASSIKAHPGQVHLTVGIVKYEAHGRPRKGVCSTFMAERVPDQSTMGVFMHTNKNFRLPSDPMRPVIMIGPGTGIAPFRAYLEERKVTGAKGKNWLFFGDQHAASDFLYREELEGMQKDGFLTRLDLAFSRDQKEKVYVQNRMIEHADEFYKWLQEGAHLYVCGDASRMAKDVDKALHDVYQKCAGLSPEGAVEAVAALKKEKRYQRDVY